LNIAEAVLNVCFSIAFLLQFGIVGAALGSVTAMVLTNFLLLPRETARCLGLSYAELTRKILLPIAVPLLGLSAIGVMFTRLVNAENGLWTLSISMALSVLLVVACACWIGPQRRQFYIFYIKKLLITYEKTPTL